MELNNYHSLCAEYYDIDKPFAPENELNFYMNYVKNSTGNILEPMCGTGRFLLPILNVGFNIEGYDASSNMLHILKQKALNQGLTPNVWLQLAEVPTKRANYSLIFIPSGSFGLIVENKKIKLTLKNIYNQLVAGGTFVFEVETLTAAPKQLNTWLGDIRYRTDSSYILLNTLNLPPKNSINSIVCKYELIIDNFIKKSEIEIINIKLYSVYEISSLLEEAGFIDINIYSDYNFNTELKNSDELIICECKKKN